VRGGGRRFVEGEMPVDAYGGWTVGGDGRTVVGVCACGEAAVTDCPVCGPQCQRCFIGGG
jgi:hypothetical protein